MKTFQRAKLKTAGRGLMGPLGLLWPSVYLARRWLSQREDQLYLQPPWLTQGCASLHNTGILFTPLLLHASPVTLYNRFRVEQKVTQEIKLPTAHFGRTHGKVRRTQSIAIKKVKNNYILGKTVRSDVKLKYFTKSN